MTAPGKGGSGGRRSAAWAAACGAAATAGLVAVYASVPGLRGAARLVVGAAAVAAIVLGVRRHRPARPWAWWLLAAAVALFQVADVGAFSMGDGAQDWRAWTWAAAYPPAAAGIGAMVWCRVSRHDLAGLLDTLVVVAALAFPAWLLLGPVADAAVSGQEQAVTIVPVVFEVLLLGFATRALADSAARGASWWLLVGGVVVTAAADVAAGIVRAGHPGRPAGHAWSVLVAGGWLGCALCWGAAALHPSMVRNTLPSPALQAISRPVRLVATYAAALVTPAALLWWLVRGDAVDAPGLVITLVVSTMVLARLALASADQRRARTREAVLIQANASLAAALGSGQVHQAVCSAVGRLLGAGVAHKAVVEEAGPAAWPSGPQAGSASGLSGSQVGSASGLSGSQVGSAAGPSASQAGSAGEPSVSQPGQAAFPVSVAQLPPRSAARLSGFDQAMVLSLRSPPGDRLVVAAAPPVLAEAAGWLRILADAAAAALDRIESAAGIARRDGQRYFQALVRDNSDPVFVVDDRLRVRYASPAASEVFGSAGAAGGVLEQAVGPSAAGEVAAWAAGGRGRGRVRFRWLLKGPLGADWEAEASVSDLRTDPAVGGLVLSLRDVTASRRLETVLRRQAFHDPLTGLPNRAGFLRALDAVGALPSGDVLRLVLADVDGMREINDAHGQEVGDEVLRVLAGMLRERLAPGDVLARTGSDEFAILQIRTTRRELSDLARDIPGRFAPFPVGPVQVTVSGATATATGAGPWSPGLLTDAEIALRTAKAGHGTSSWRAYTMDMRTALERGAACRAALDESLADGTFTALYQPIVFIDNAIVGGFEALIRWPRPGGRLALPDEFIPVAEASGQIVGVGRWILREAACQAAAWNRHRAEQGLLPMRLAVNVAAPQLSDPAFHHTVTEALDDSGLDPDSLVLEVTERLLIRNSGATADNIRILSGDGVRMSLDDFGTGYSSLSYLRDLPVTSLKIDKSFTADVTASPRQAALVRGIIDIAKTLGLVVIAEGVETDEQRALLADMGADLGQGYLFDRPLAADVATGRVLATDVDGPILRRQTARPNIRM